MTSSIIICTNNRAIYLRQTLEAMRFVEAPVGGCELIVVDNASTDDTAEVVNQCRLPNMPIRYLHEPRRGKGYAYNSGMAAAEGDILLFTDDDVRPAGDWIQRMCAPILAQKADAVIGSVHIAPHLERPWMQAAHMMMLASTDATRPGASYYLVGANMAFSRKVLEKVPAFDVELGPGALGFADETLLTSQLREAGYQFAEAPDAHIVHHFDVSRLSRASFVDRMEKQGHSNAYIAYHWEHRDTTLLPLRLIKSRLKLLYRRFSRQSDYKVKEGLALWEMGLISEIHFYQQMQKEKKRPRNYEKRGLVKINHRNISSASS